MIKSDHELDHDRDHDQELDVSMFQYIFLSFISLPGCLLGKYGENCTKICNHRKNNLSCDTQSGRCNSEGCALPGFQMPYCQSS